MENQDTTQKSALTNSNFMQLKEHLRKDCPHEPHQKWATNYGSSQRKTRSPQQPRKVGRSKNSILSLMGLRTPERRSSQNLQTWISENLRRSSLQKQNILAYYRPDATTIPVRHTCQTKKPQDGIRRNLETRDNNPIRKALLDRGLGPFNP